MEFVSGVLILTSFAAAVQGAIQCHDCSSWNPYCRDRVDEPFESAVAAIDCGKTSTCFLKKDETGLIYRGCADWWMESQVDIHYIGCQTQHVPWLGEMTWCFCKEDFCNGGSLNMMANKIYPVVQKFQYDEEGEQDWGDYTVWEENWDGTNKVEEKPKVEEKIWDDKKKKEEEKGAAEKVNEIGDTGNKWGQNAKVQIKTFDDLHPGYQGLSDRKKSDTKYQLWFWHAESDRPRWKKDNDDDDNDGADYEVWRAPEWVETEEGENAEQSTHHDQQGQDGDRNAFNDGARAPNSGPSDAAAGGKEITTPNDSWNWGQGWGHIKPWWLREGEEESTVKPNRWTPHPTRAPGTPQQDDGYGDSAGKWDEVNKWQSSSEDLENSDYDDDGPDLLELAQQEFFCWDCYSDSELCGQHVDIQKANYLGKTSCTITQKCFVRNDRGVIYRGCADGWTSSVIDTDYLGCRKQHMWGRQVQWCFCSASLCNGDTMDSIDFKYSIARLQPYRQNASAAVSRDNDTSSSAQVQSTVQSEIFAAASRDVTPSHRLPESTEQNNYNINTTMDFGASRTDGVATGPNTLDTSTQQNKPSHFGSLWKTPRETGKESRRNGSDVLSLNNNGTQFDADDRRVNKTQYTALIG